MILPSQFSSMSEQLLQKLSFELIEPEDHEFCVWRNETMKFGLEYGRTYYNSYVLPLKKPFERLYLIKLLRFLKNDPMFYAKELIVTNLSYTLPVNEYVSLFYKNYEDIKEFIVEFNEEIFNKYDNYVVEYNGI